MQTYKLCFELLSATTFGRGDGVASLVDREIEHDAFGLPYVRGRTVKGLLAEECANILFALDLGDKRQAWQETAESLFGSPGSRWEDRGHMRVGDARLPTSLREAVQVALDDKDQSLSPSDMLESVTAIRRQTSLNEQGAPEKGSLRSMRVILPGVIFESELDFSDAPDPKELGLLAACILAWRRAGTARNRGRGRLRAWLSNSDGQDITKICFAAFEQEVGA